ncbi:unnamed protein product [Arabis nemorensis]|uniref:YDG domain-containing protein n=1 Tax=Arabis nemorensis TaxID=586526 RepID=A0A565C3N7_9BRAS|nr:unnamed protein product [Arabis nemorensis]
MVLISTRTVKSLNIFMCQKMVQRNSPSKRKRVSGVRDFPNGCGTQTKNPRTGIVSEDAGTVTRSESGQSLIGSENSCVGGVVDQDHHQRSTESIDSVMKKAGFNCNVGSGSIGSAKRNFTSTCGSKVKPLTPEESRRLIASQNRRRQLSFSSTNIRRNSSLSNAVAPRANTHKPSQQRDGRRSNQAGLIPVTQHNRITKVLTPREKVQKALRLFKSVFNELERDKAARRGESKTATSRIDYQTRNVLVEERRQVNAEKRIGPVPGIEIGDVFQYKSELNLVGLHFDIMGGIDYMNRGDLKLATSIVSSEGNGYSDVFNSGVLVYTGEGGNVRNDQRLVRGNLALANSMREKTPVRVILGKTRVDQKGKHYVYDGLYLVEKYWQERGPGGNLVFKFKLVRVSGQPSVGLKR